MPSFLPINPRCSVVVALIFTQSGDNSRTLAIQATMAFLWGLIFGAWAKRVASRLAMPNPRESATYITYILRCWQEGSNWRYSLEEVGVGERHGFASLDEFVAFMLARATPPESGMEAISIDEQFN